MFGVHRSIDRPIAQRSVEEQRRGERERKRERKVAERSIFYYLPTYLNHPSGGTRSGRGQNGLGMPVHMYGNTSLGTWEFEGVD